VVLGYDADGGYGHPDHVVAHEVLVAAAARAGVPRVLAVVRPRSAVTAALARLTVPADLRAPERGELAFEVDDATVDVAVDVRWWASLREAALAAHATQVRVIEGGFALSNGIAQPLLDHEYFRVLAGGPVPRGADGGPAADVFAGLP
jgi:N-acetyl-1-D-myo-inositol-2-amino-2-deoxy-alpha-D-glucopyranoside deacetylase